MPIVDVSDLDWYIDHVLAVSEPGVSRVGPCRLRQGRWLGAARSLRIAAAGTVVEGAVELACRQGFVLRRQQAIAAGVDTATQRRLLRSGQWSSPRRGVLCPMPASTAANDPGGSAREIQATAAALVRPGTVISHDSAALLHGLPVLSSASARPSLSSVYEAHTSQTRNVLIRAAGQHPGDIVDWFGAPVKSIACAINEIARASGVAAGLVAADAARNDHLVSLEELRRARVSAHHRPGSRHAERVLNICSTGAESALESLVRLCLLDGGLPAPAEQAWIDTDAGRFRVDLLFPATRTVVEADGNVKYSDEDRLALVREKRRQHALERAAYDVVRVTWDDVTRKPADVVARVTWAMRYPRIRRVS